MKRRILFKVEKNRVLVPVGEPCPFGCRYCYTRGGEVGLTRVSVEDILVPFRRFAQEASFDTIQFGYDGDPFARPERGIAMLSELATMGKHLNFSTKARLDLPTVDALRAIRQRMDEDGTTLSALVSLSCWESSLKVEPHTPTSAERIQTVASLKRIGVPAFIAIRPVLPHIDDTEYERIVEEGLRAGSEGFVLGPLYADARGRFVRFVPPDYLNNMPSRTSTVSWSAHAPVWTRYEETERLERLLRMIERKGGRTFVSSADVMDMVQGRMKAA